MAVFTVAYLLEVFQKSMLNFKRSWIMDKSKNLDSQKICQSQEVQWSSQKIHRKNTITNPINIRLYRKKGRFFWVQKKGPSPSFFFCWMRPFFFEGTFFNVPFFPPYFFLEPLFFLKGCFFPLFYQICWFCCFYASCQPRFFLKKYLPFERPFFFWSSPFFVEGQFLLCPFFCRSFFFALLAI